MVLLLGHLLHPFDRLAVERLLNGDMCHGRGRRGAMPMLLASFEPDDISRADLLDLAAVALYPTAAEGDNQRLPQRVGVPRRARSRLECDRVASGARRRGGRKQRVEPYRAREPVVRAFCRRL